MRRLLHRLPGNARSQTPLSQSRTPIPWSRHRNGFTTRADGQLIGTVGLREINPEHCHAEMGFWIGVDWWGNGYATETARVVLRYGFAELKLNRIYAQHMVRNPAAGRVLEKIGMKPEGLLRQTVRKWGVFENVVLMAILRDDWRKRKNRHS